MVQVYFGNIRSYDDLGLFFFEATISNPEAKRNLVNVQGMDGNLDLTPVTFGDTKFANRQLTLAFVMKDYARNWMANFSAVYNRIHGKRFRIVIGNDPYYYWDGFCTVNRTKDTENKGEIQVVCDVHPYKLRDISISVQSTAEGITVACPCGRKSVCPEVTTDGSITITPEGQSAIHYDAGTKKNRDLMLTEGTNMLLITGNANVTLAYTEGVL